MLTPREATEAPRQWSRSPFSPTEVTESATILVFLILSALLCSVNNADLKTATWLLYCLRLRSRSPHNAQHSTSYWGERERAPSCGLNGRAVTIYRYIDVRRPYVHRYCACAALRVNVAGRIGNMDSVQLSQHFLPASDRDRISPAESAFLISWDNAMIWDFKREGDALFRNLQVS